MLLDQKTEISGRFTWLIHFQCNYRCPYCFYYEGGGWEILGQRNIYLSPDEWLIHWRRLYKRYGRFAIVITGGEPFTYPNFIEIIAKLSNMHFPINISTNTSGDLETFAKLIDRKRVSLTLSFHPEFDNLNNFIKKVKLLRNSGFRGFTNFVAYPPYIKDILFYIKEFGLIKERLKIIPFRGIFKENAYPWSYSKKEISVMGIDPHWFNKIQKKGKSCQAGKETAVLLPDGLVARCGQLFYNFIIGNFFDNDFKLLNEILPCDREICPCDEDKIFEEGDLYRDNKTV